MVEERMIGLQNLTQSLGLHADQTLVIKVDIAKLLG